jgi:uncharacterized membrane protein
MRLPLCNGRIETAPRLFGHGAPLCWRCLSIIAAMAISAPIAPQLATAGIWLALAAALVAVGIVDGYCSYFTARGSTNPRRVLSGLGAGLGLSILSGWLTPMLPIVL